LSASVDPLTEAIRSCVMSIITQFKSLTPGQRHAITASFLGWTLDAFDFFIFVFILTEIAQEFSAGETLTTFAVVLTLATRPIGAFLFGIAADKYGRRPILMLNIILFSLFEFASGFAPNLATLMILRALYGVAMGGEWGVGASLTMETIPQQSRGFVSGLLQAGYPSGYLLASLVYALFGKSLGWRGMFMVGILPALLVLYIRRNVEESPSFQTSRSKGRQIWAEVRKRRNLIVYTVILMTAFAFLSHGTQDFYPTFLKKQLKFAPPTVGTIAIVYNIGAILGGITFGAISQRIGRRRAIIIPCLLLLPTISIWVFPTNPVFLALGAWVMQFFVQGAWGSIPVHLNELSPPGIRGTFPGLTYQVGQFFAAINLTMQSWLTVQFGGNYAYSLALVAAVVAVVIVVLIARGPEAKNVQL
jgi:MFS transporter, SHS family, lactate transporter